MPYRFSASDYYRRRGRRGKNYFSRRGASFRGFGPGTMVPYGFPSGGKTELKYWDANNTPWQCDPSAPGLWPLNLLSTGTDATSVIGREFSTVSLQLRIAIRWIDYSANGPATINARQALRFVLVWDKVPSGVQTSAGDVFLIPTITGTMLNLNNRDRFVILWDKIINIDASGAGAYWDDVLAEEFMFIPGGSYMFKKYFKFRPGMLRTVKSGTDGSIGSFQQGLLTLFVFADNNWAQVGNMVVAPVSRVRVYDV